MRKPLIGVVSLGCPKNTTDTEVMLGLLNQAGFEITFDNSQADMCLVNTCSFIADARQESVRTLVELAHQDKELIITGCLAQHFKEELLNEIPEARAVIGTGDIQSIVNVIEAVVQDSSLRVVQVSDIPNDYSEEVLPRLPTGIGASAYLKIAEGCDHRCSFCIIPILRGNFRSRTIDSLVKEARILVKSGVKELILISQDSTYYGLDIYGRMALSELLRQLNNIDGVDWIRIMYFYPSETNDELLKTISELPKVVKYIDLPLQHSHPEILSTMARPKSPEKVVERIRQLVPDVCIRSTFIVGFPGEEEEHFQHLAEFIKRHRFDRLGVFTYSRQMEVSSGHMKNQVPEKIKKARRKEIMQIQREISNESNQATIGRTIDVLIESFHESKQLYVGRSQWDAPQIDHQVYVKDNEELINVGDLARVRIESALPYDLYGIATD